MGDPEIIFDSLLCFIHSASSDYSYESLFDVVYAFYSHEEIKNAKEKICVLLKKDIVWRRDPEKKKKDLRDLLDFCEEFKANNRSVKFVTTSHKKMPPIGMEMFAPILTNLAEDIAKLNEVVPKILDIKSEVCNTADTVRQMKLDINELNKKFTFAVNGMEEATKEAKDNEFDVMNELRSFRQAVGRQSIASVGNNSQGNLNNIFDNSNRQDEDLIVDIDDDANYLSNNISFADVVSKKSASDSLVGVGRSGAVGNKKKSPVKVVDRITGAISKLDQVKKSAVTPRDDIAGDNERASKPSNNDEVLSVEKKDDKWTLVGRNKKNNNRRGNAGGFAGVTGAGKDANNRLKAVARTADVFVGRLDREVTEDEIKSFIKQSFDIDVFSVCKLDIISDVYNAFKVCVKANERSKLFDAEKWPEDIIVNKFYKKRSNNGDRKSASSD